MLCVLCTLSVLCALCVLCVLCTLCVLRAPRRVSRQVRHQVPRAADGTHARTAPAVRHREGLVQVQVAHVRADAPRRGEPDLRVHVRAVHVHLCAVEVRRVHQLADALLEQPVRRGVRDHRAPERVLVLRRLALEVRDVDVPLRVALHHHHVEPRHRAARGVRPVRGLRHEAHPAVPLPRRVQVVAHRQHPGVLPRGAAGGLQRAPAHLRDLRQHPLELAHERRVPRLLLLGRERVHVRELRPRQGRHDRRRVQLHRARPQRDHVVLQPDVLALQLVQVPRHRVLAVVRAELAVRHEGRRPPVRRRHLGHRVRARELRHREGHAPALRERVHQPLHVLERRRLVERHRHPVADLADVDPALAAAALERGGTPRVAQRAEHRVERLPRGDGHPQPAQRLAEQVRLAADRARDVRDPLRTVVHPVEPGERADQRRRRADVRRRTLALDVLLARLERHAQRGRARRVLRHPD